jgi:hypothetical protein
MRYVLLPLTPPCARFDADLATQNQMQDAMTIWDSICHSQWFKSTSIVSRLVVLTLASGRRLTVFKILFLNKNDLFEKKIPNSNIKNFFPVRSSSIQSLRKKNSAS